MVLDLFSRQVIGWSMKPQMTSDLAIDALLMAVWRRKPKQEVMIHSDSKNVDVRFLEKPMPYSVRPIVESDAVKQLG